MSYFFFVKKTSCSQFAVKNEFFLSAGRESVKVNMRIQTLASCETNAKRRKTAKRKKVDIVKAFAEE